MKLYRLRWNRITELDKSLSHPGITKLSSYVKMQNFLYSLDNDKTIVRACQDCCEVKASFLELKESLNLIKATQPFQRLSMISQGLFKQLQIIKICKLYFCLRL